MNSLDKKSGFIEVVNDDEKNTINQELAEQKSLSNQSKKKDLVANVFSNVDALTGEKIDDFGVVHSELEPITEKAPETIQNLAESKSMEKSREEKKDAKAEAKKESGNETKNATPPVKFGPKDLTP